MFICGELIFVLFRRNYYFIIVKYYYMMNPHNKINNISDSKIQGCFFFSQNVFPEFLETSLNILKFPLTIFQTLKKIE